MKRQIALIVALVAPVFSLLTAIGSADETTLSLTTATSSTATSSTATSSTAVPPFAGTPPISPCNGGLPTANTMTGTAPDASAEPPSWDKTASAVIAGVGATGAEKFRKQITSGGNTLKSALLEHPTITPYIDRSTSVLVKPLESKPVKFTTAWAQIATWGYFAYEGATTAWGKYAAESSATRDGPALTARLPAGCR